ncbi:MAG: hypothetical protein KGJ44_00785 [Betaproteobacteria bacterium]|nr:hypothetical protein [Betaproteobacteria bacterium]MDE2046922.1 hypothetical protein [Betaproteobacteria bacterium]
MNPFFFVTQPIATLWDAVAKPFQAAFVVGLCWFINRFTSPDVAWWPWVAFGMSIAVLVAWARAFKTLVLLAVVFYVGRWVYRKYGDAAKARFDDWVRGRDAATSGPAAAAPTKDAKEVLRLVGNDLAVREAGLV